MYFIHTSQTVACPRGQQFDQRTEDCVHCREGMYQDEHAQVDCKECPNGTRTDGRGARGVSECYGIKHVSIYLFIY